MMIRQLSACSSVLIVAASQSFSVAEVKPHYGCTSLDGQQRVRDYVASLVAAKTGLISLIETEFEVPQPHGYTAFGAACGKHVDPAVVLVDEEQFEIVSTIGATAAGNYSAMPFIGGQPQAPENATNWMCISDPLATYGPDGAFAAGSRPYAGAVLLHKASGKEVCMVTGTFAHCLFEWTEQFVADVDEGCGDRQLLIVADTNAGCEVPTLKSDSHWSMNDILANHSKSDWGPCHDPGLFKEPTCCNDFPDFPYPRYNYDRTAICRGGRIGNHEVKSSFICGDSHAEHLSTTSTVYLSSADDSDSAYCLDHPSCAKMGVVKNESVLPADGVHMYGGEMLPADGLCCPTSMTNTRLSCCDESTLV